MDVAGSGGNEKSSPTAPPQPPPGGDGQYIRRATAAYAFTLRMAPTASAMIGRPAVRLLCCERRPLRLTHRRRAHTQ